MITGRIRLKAGVPATHALDTLRSLIAAADQIRLGDASLSAGPVAQKAYVEWVETVEGQLASISFDHDLIGMLHTERYWRIRAIHDKVLRPVPLVTAERDLQKAALIRLADDLDRRVRQFTRAPGRITVLDTNLLLHFHPPDSIPWQKALGRDNWRLVIPLRVIEELDGKKYSNSKLLRDRARSVLPRLEPLIGDDGSPRLLQPDVTIEVPIEQGPRYRLQDADEEILVLCTELPQLADAPVTLVTGDASLRLRARAQGTHAIELADNYRRDRDDD